MIRRTLPQCVRAEDNSSGIAGFPRARRKQMRQKGDPSLPDRLFKVADNFPQRTALVTPYGDMSYGYVKKSIFEFANTLSHLPNWRKGERVGICLPNGLSYVAAFYGTLLAGGVAIPIPVEQRPEWVKEVMFRTNCSWIVNEGSNGRITRTSASPLMERTASIPADLAAIFFTSGSSGQPKGVMLSHANLVANAKSIVKSLPLLLTDRALAILPFCHAYGNSVLQTHLLSGATLIVDGCPLFPQTLVDVIRSQAVTSFAGVPDLHQLLYRASDLFAESIPTLRYATVAGGSLHPEMTRKIADRLAPAEFFVMYGQTEATARLSCISSRDLESHRGSIGRGLPDLTLQVVDGEERPVLPGAIGELRASGPNIMLGYWDDEDTTSRVLRDGWLYTGDLGTIDEDGYIYLRGRSSQLVKIGGYRVHPAEIEAVMSEKLPECDPVVVSYESPQGLTRLAMYLTPNGTDRIPQIHEIRECCQRHLCRYQRPEIIEVLASPPLTPSLKVDRQALSLRARMATRQSLAATGLH